MKVALAGGTGFLGRHVAHALGEAGHEVVCLARTPREDVPSFRRCDVTQGPLATEPFAGCGAIVNLVGIKRPDADVTFERAHVTAVQNLVDVARAAGIERLVHVSVAGSHRNADDPYQDTKARGEEVVAASGLAFTVLRPGIIHGRGDDLLTSLVRGIRLGPIFPVPAGPEGPLQLVAVEDVAAAVVASLERPIVRGRTYDIVGPERLGLRALVRRVSDAMELRTWIVPVPLAIERAAASAMERWMRAPLVTRSQIEMLARGVTGDGLAARQDLGLAPQPLSAERVQGIEREIPGLFGQSARVVQSRDHAAWLRGFRPALGPLLWLAPLAIGALSALSMLPSVWARMAVLYAGLIPLSVRVVRVPWRALFRPSLGDFARGVGWGLVLYVLGRIGFAVLAGWSPGAAEDLGTVLAWRSEIPLALAGSAMVLAVVGEEVFWRAALTLPLAGRIGPSGACLVSASLYALAHLTVGPPLLMGAAFGLGLALSLLLVRTRSAFTVLVCHLVWDLLVVWLIPYGHEASPQYI